jgi:hypothetical protein
MEDTSEVSEATREEMDERTEDPVTEATTEAASEVALPTIESIEAVRSEALAGMDMDISAATIEAATMGRMVENLMIAV